MDEIKTTARWLGQVAALFFNVLDEEIVPATPSDSYADAEFSLSDSYADVESSLSDSNEASSSDTAVAGADPPARDKMV